MIKKIIKKKVIKIQWTKIKFQSKVTLMKKILPQIIILLRKVKVIVAKIHVKVNIANVKNVN